MESCKNVRKANVSMTSSMTACSRRSSGERWTTWGRSGPGGRHKTDLGFLRIKSVRMEHLTASMAGTSSTFNRIMLKSDLSRDIGYHLLRQQINKKYSPQNCVKNNDFFTLGHQAGDILLSNHTGDQRELKNITKSHLSYGQNWQTNVLWHGSAIGGTCQINSVVIFIQWIFKMYQIKSLEPKSIAIV